MKSRGYILALVLAGLIWSAPALAATASAARAAPVVMAAPVPAAPPTVSAAPMTSPAAPAPLAAEDIRDIRGPIPIPEWWRWLALGAGAALLAALSGIAFVLIKRRRARPLKPFEVALRRLEKAQPLAEAGQAREYAAEASDAVRQYIENCFVVRAAHLTTEEFFEGVVGQAQSPLGKHKDALVKFLGACDMAKFARFPLLREAMVSLNESARRFVVETAHPAPDSQPARMT